MQICKSSIVVLPTCFATFWVLLVSSAAMAQVGLPPGDMEEAPRPRPPQPPGPPPDDPGDDECRDKFDEGYEDGDGWPNDWRFPAGVPAAPRSNSTLADLGPAGLPRSVFRETGSTYEAAHDLGMPTVGPTWSHVRSYDSLLDSTSSDNETEQGWLWRHSMMPSLTSANEASYENADVSVIFSAYFELFFENTATDTWDEADHHLFEWV